MSQQVEYSKIGLVNEYSRGFPSNVSYRTHDYDSVVQTTSSRAFINSRTELMDGFLTEDKKIKWFEVSQSYLAEQLVRIAIKSPLEERGFFLDLAPQSLEHGNNQKGVDLIIVDSCQTICLGIDLKLKKSRNKSGHDGYGWCQNILSPFIYLKMGDWSLETREETDVNIRQWIQKYTCPKLKTTGKIPRVYELRQYLIPRVTNTLNTYLEALDRPKDEFSYLYIPEDRQSVNLLKNKLLNLYSLFSDLSQKYCPESQNT